MFTLTLKDSVKEAKNTRSFLFEPEEPLEWEAGQFLHYFLEHNNPDDRGEDRYFTIASAPHEGHVMLTTRKEPYGSTFKNALFNLRKGDTIKAEGPEGDFVMEFPERQHVFIAGGVGITPYRAILLDLEENMDPVNVTLLYGNGTQDFVYEDLLDHFQEEYPGFNVERFVTPDRIEESDLERMEENLQEPVFWISGPEPMVESLGDVLEQDIHVEEDRIKHDWFPGYEWDW